MSKTEKIGIRKDDPQLVEVHCGFFSITCPHCGSELEEVVEQALQGNDLRCDCEAVFKLEVLVRARFLY